MCHASHMAASVEADDKLIDEARCLGRHKTKREAVRAALNEYIHHQKQLGLIEAFGTFEFDPEYDYKTKRGRKMPRA